MGFLDNLARHSHIIHLQETHGAEEHFAVHCHYICKYFYLIASGCDSDNSGGVATLISKNWVTCKRGLQVVKVVPGRVLRTSISDGAKTLVTWNVHNFALTGTDQQAVETLLQADVEFALHSPDRFGIFLGGDLNFVADGEVTFRPNEISNDVAARDVADPLGRPGAAFWRRNLRQLTEIATDTFSHYYAPRNALNRIDR